MSMKYQIIIPGSLAAIAILSGAILASSNIYADDVVDQINITVPISCSLSGTGMNAHNAEINNGQYNSAIGETTIKAFCNDNNGFAIYAIGYTDDTDGKNVLTSSTLGSTHDIATGTATSGDTSNWAMKLSTVTDPAPTYPIVIAGSSADTDKEQGDPDYSTFQAVPDDYTLVAKRTSGTDIGQSAEGSTLKTTYQAYISKTQSAGTYTGQVKYTLVHPHSTNKPIANPATLDTGRTVNSKLKSLAATVVNGEETTITPTFNPDTPTDYFNASDNYIKAINVHVKTPTPSNFTPTEANTISVSTSKKPIYIIFDNTDNAGIMHFYTEGDQILLPADSSFMFYYIQALADLSMLSDWDTSNAINVSYMFYRVGASSSVSTFVFDPSSWDTSSVTNMSHMFQQFMFSSSISNFALNLSSWNTINVENMEYMFDFAGNAASDFSLNLSSWNTSNVINMSNIFNAAGYPASTWSVIIPQTNGDDINNTASRLYGKTSSVYGEPVNDNSFTIAQ